MKPKSLLDTPWNEWPEWAVDSMRERVAIMVHEAGIEQGQARMQAAWMVEKERIEREKADESA